MTRWEIVALRVIFLRSSLIIFTLYPCALALEAGIGVYYAPGMAVGPAASSLELNPGGAAARLFVDVSDRVAVNVGYSLNNYTYGRWGSPIPEVFVVEPIKAHVITGGVEYAFAAGTLRPFAGGGAAIARESAEAHGHSAADWYGGLYAEGGARYSIGGSFAVEAAPRYTYLFDEPAVLYDDFNVHGFVRSEHHSQLVELLVGVNYYF
jgi:opacity protein-like surface antigen